MNDADVSKQVQQMVHFIRQEAEEKANEIAVSAEEVRHYVQSLTPCPVETSPNRVSVDIPVSVPTRLAFRDRCLGCRSST